MAVTARKTTEPRWHRTLSSADTLDDDLGSIGAWVGPRTGPDKRSHGEKEDYVLRRLIVAWKEEKLLEFPLDVSATFDDKGEPDFTLTLKTGETLGVEVTEAGEEDYQAWLTRVERDGVKGSREESITPFSVSTTRTASEIRDAIERKIAKFKKGWYGHTSECDLVVYDNTAMGGYLHKEKVVRSIVRPEELLGYFRQIHLVSDTFVLLDIFGNDFRNVDIGKTYEIDYAAWIFDQVEHLRAGATEKLDITHITEELESLARRDRRSLGSHLRNLMFHLLKWQFQPGKRSESWRLSIFNARSEIYELLSEMRSLRGELKKLIPVEYSRARRQAAGETKMNIETFPAVCPYTKEQLVDPDFLPGNDE